MQLGLFYGLRDNCALENFNMAEHSKRLSLVEVVDTFFADEDSESDNILLGSENESLEDNSAQDSEWEYCSSSDGKSQLFISKNGVNCNCYYSDLFKLFRIKCDNSVK